MTEPAAKPAQPWDRWIGATPKPTPFNRLYLGLLAAGRKPVGITDIGKPGRSQGSVTVFACGCERTYRVQFGVPPVETETLNRCESDRNLLTPGPDWAQDADVESKARPQQEHHDDPDDERHDDPDDL